MPPSEEEWEGLNARSLLWSLNPGLDFDWSLPHLPTCPKHEPVHSHQSVTRLWSGFLFGASESLWTDTTMHLAEYFQILIFWASALTKPVCSHFPICFMFSRCRDCPLSIPPSIPSAHSMSSGLSDRTQEPLSSPQAATALHAPCIPAFLVPRIKDSLKFLQKELRQLLESSLPFVSLPEPPGQLFTLFSARAVCLLWCHLCGWAACESPLLFPCNVSIQLPHRVPSSTSGCSFSFCSLSIYLIFFHGSSSDFLERI